MRESYEMMQMCLEWWTWEALTLMTGLLEDAEVNVGVMGILFQIVSIASMPPVGLEGDPHCCLHRLEMWVN